MLLLVWVMNFMVMVDSYNIYCYVFYLDFCQFDHISFGLRGLVISRLVLLLQLGSCCTVACRILNCKMCGSQMLALLHTLLLEGGRVQCAFCKCTVLSTVDTKIFYSICKYCIFHKDQLEYDLKRAM